MLFVHSPKDYLVWANSHRGGVMPLKAVRSMLEEEILLILVVKEPPPPLPVCAGVALDLIPRTLERVDNLAPNVSHDLSN